MSDPGAVLRRAVVEANRRLTEAHEAEQIAKRSLQKARAAEASDKAQLEKAERSYDPPKSEGKTYSQREWRRIFIDRGVSANLVLASLLEAVSKAEAEVAATRQLCADTPAGDLHDALSHSLQLAAATLSEKEQELNCKRSELESQIKKGQQELENESRLLKARDDAARSHRERVGFVENNLRKGVAAARLSHSLRSTLEKLQRGLQTLADPSVIEQAAPVPEQEAGSAGTVAGPPGDAGGDDTSTKAPGPGVLNNVGDDAEAASVVVSEQTADVELVDAGGDDTRAEALDRGVLSGAGCDADAASTVVSEQMGDVDQSSQGNSQGGADPCGEPVPGFAESVEEQSSDDPTAVSLGKRSPDVSDRIRSLRQRVGI